MSNSFDVEQQVEATNAAIAKNKASISRVRASIGQLYVAERMNELRGISESQAAVVRHIEGERKRLNKRHGI